MRNRILKGASKYIEQFKGKFFVLKYGGSILDDEAISDSILDDIICFHHNGIHVVLVHGGGSAISKFMKARGKEPKFIDGLRVTDKETARIVDEALTEVNTGLANRIRARGVQAESLVSREHLIIKAKRKPGALNQDFVGEVDSVDIKFIKQAIENNAIPIVSPVGIDNEKNLYNINADIAASEIAAALSCEKFILLTNVRGVMRDKENDASLFSTLTEEQLYKLIEQKVIDGGMIPKVKACISALDKGVKKIHIISGRINHSVLIEVFTDEGVGTQIIKDKG